MKQKAQVKVTTVVAVSPVAEETIAVEEFQGASTTGTWRLTIADHASRDVGTLNSWALVIGHES